MSLMEKFISGAIVALLFIVVPKIYKKGEANKKEHIKNKKVYYGIFRMIGLYALAIMSGEMVLVILLGNSGIDGMIALAITVACSIPVMFLYLHLYRKHYQKLIDEFHSKK